MNKDEKVMVNYSVGKINLSNFMARQEEIMKLDLLNKVRLKL
jgi:hypothetical protein